MKMEDLFIFDIEKCQPQELAECQIGDYVNLWVPKDSKQVRIFRRGTVGGTGLVGYVPGKYSKIIARHLNDGLKCETEILEIDTKKSRGKIRCRLISRQEMLAKQANDLDIASSNLHTELLAKYKPKNPVLNIKIQLPKNHNLVVGQEIFLENKPIEYYLKNAMRLSVNFIDNNGFIVAQKSYEPKIIRSLLRAYFNKYPIRIIIQKINTPDQYTLKYVEFIEADVQISLG